MKRLPLIASVLFAGPAVASYAECEAAQRTYNRLLHNGNQLQSIAWILETPKLSLEPFVMGQ